MPPFANVMVTFVIRRSYRFCSIHALHTWSVNHALFNQSDWSIITNLDHVLCLTSGRSDVVCFFPQHWPGWMRALEVKKGRSCGMNDLDKAPPPFLLTGNSLLPTIAYHTLAFIFRITKETGPSVVVRFYTLTSSSCYFLSSTVALPNPPWVQSSTSCISYPASPSSLSFSPLSLPQTRSSAATTITAFGGSAKDSKLKTTAASAVRQHSFPLSLQLLIANMYMCVMDE
jgi:hypothetical protein